MNAPINPTSSTQSSCPNWTTLDFGENEGRSLPQVLFTNPDWFFWAMERNAFKNYPSLIFQSTDLAKKAKRIKVPQSGPEILVVEHFIHRPTKKYSHFMLIPTSQPVSPGSSPAYRQDVIDLSFPRQVAPHDKTGNKNIIRSLKSVYFGNMSARMNRDRCEAFFSSPDNFDV